MSKKEHWENVYATKGDDEVSWTQADPGTSVALIREVASEGAVIDVGGGTSSLAERLLDAGYLCTVLDISEAALRRSKEKLGSMASKIRWIAGDITAIESIGTFDVWHDRAVFHFLTSADDRRKYTSLAKRSVPVGGHAVIGTFALDGPEKCSGLEVERYDSPKLLEQFGPGFAISKEVAETHFTPWGNPQQFQFVVLERVHPTIQPELLRQWLQDGRPVVVVDVRNDQDRAKGSIPGSIHFDAHAALKANDPTAMDSLDVPANACIVTVCNSGHSAAAAAQLLQQKGLDARSLAGGMKAWSKAQGSA